MGVVGSFRNVAYQGGQPLIIGGTLGVLGMDWSDRLIGFVESGYETTHTRLTVERDERVAQ